jgi:uncharacterized membrane protein
MNTLIDFLKTTVIGGFFILLPLLLFGILFDEILEAVVGLATPIADLFPADTFEDLSEPAVVAAVLILLASFLLGLATKLAVARKFGAWVEANTIGRLPLYRAIKSLTSRFEALEDQGGFRPALVRGPGDQYDLAYLMEEVGGGYVSVMLPRAPTPMIGTIKLVPLAQVELLDVSLGEFTAVISHWGVGSKGALDGADFGGGKP